MKIEAIGNHEPQNVLRIIPGYSDGPNSSITVLSTPV
jgi:hypothetical protein